MKVREGFTYSIINWDIYPYLLDCKAVETSLAMHGPPSAHPRNRTAVTSGVGRTAAGVVESVVDASSAVDSNAAAVVEMACFANSCH